MNESLPLPIDLNAPPGDKTILEELSSKDPKVLKIENYAFETDECRSIALG
jgi:hypothetical protein